MGTDLMDSHSRYYPDYCVTFAPSDPLTGWCREAKGEVGFSKNITLIKEQVLA